MSMCEHRCHCDCGPGCDCRREGHGGFHRRFATRTEQITELETYLADLKAEVLAVEERLADLRR
jgi:hypothetical protein